MKNLFFGARWRMLLFSILLAGSMTAQNPYLIQGWPGQWGAWDAGYHQDSIYPDQPTALEKPGWDLVFHDEFNDTIVDSAVWHIEDGVMGVAYCKGANTKESGGYLNITSHFISGAGEAEANGLHYNYTTGGIKSLNTSTSFTQGKYFEIRCRLPYGSSFHPGFFEFTTDPGNNDEWDEVDFLENGFMGDSYRWIVGGGHIKAVKNLPPSPSCGGDYFHSIYMGNAGSGVPYCANDGIHDVYMWQYGNPGLNEHDYTIGVDWQGDHIYTYLNNKLISVVFADATTTPKTFIPSTNMGELFAWLIINADANGNVVWQDDNGNPVNLNTIFNGINNVWKIDYIRIYQKRCAIAETPGIYGPAYGTGDETLYPHLVGDINADGRADVVVCGNVNTTSFSTSPNKWTVASLGTTSSTFTTPVQVINNFTTYHPGSTNNWPNTNTGPRMLADVNGDNKADIIGFGAGATYVSLSTSTATTPSFAAISTITTNFSVTAGYTDMNTCPRMMADVDGDGKADIVAFSNNNVYVSISHCTGSTISFATPVTLYSYFTTSAGYTDMATMPRMLVDVNNDGRADIIGFGQHGMQVSLSASNYTLGTVSFGTPILISDFGIDQGYTTQQDYPRMIADINGDGKNDIIGFGSTNTNDTKVALSACTANPTYSVSFGATTTAKNFFTKVNGGFTTLQNYPRFVSDINCDGKADIIGIAEGEVKVSLSECSGSTINFDNYQNSIIRDFTWDAGLPYEFGDTRFEPRLMADVNGDGKKDLLGFGYFNTKVFSCFSNATCGGGNQRDLTDGIPGENNNNIDFTIYPNPNTGDFTLRIPEGMSIVQAEVLNVLGERVLLQEHPATGADTELHIGNNAKGIYMVRLLSADGKTYQKKMLIE